jgi:transcription termination/antitermination protein NusG
LPHDGAQWFVLWTHSHSERLVHDQLTGRGFETFLPTLTTWSRRKGAQAAIETPMFPGYVFVRHAIDKGSYVEILKTRGLVRILGERWDRLTPVPDAEIDAVRSIAESGILAFPYPHLREGQRVVITDGPLAGLEGLLVATKPHKGLLVVSVELLQRSVAVEVDCTRVRPVAATVERPRRVWVAAEQAWDHA